VLLTTNDIDSLCVCNSDIREEGQHYQSWPDNVAVEYSPFVGSGSLVCDQCSKRLGWVGAESHDIVLGRRPGVVHIVVAKKVCEQNVPTTCDNFDFSGMCRTHNIPVESGQRACVHLKEDDDFCEDCQLDFCSIDGNQKTVDKPKTRSMLGTHNRSVQCPTIRVIQ